MRASFALIGLALLAGCVEQPPIGPKVTTADVIANIHAWNGKEVLVTGWLGQCQRYDCGLYPTLSDAKLVEEGSSGSPEWMTAMDRRLSIGPGKAFDRRAQGLAMKEVIVRATITDQCRQRDQGSSCLDRAGDLIPVQVYPKD